jgi:hypothetical protein
MAFESTTGELRLEAREQLTILDYKIKIEEESLRKSQQNK